MLSITLSCVVVLDDRALSCYRFMFQVALTLPSFYQNFYLFTRRALTHPACNDGTWTNPKTKEEWESKASVKLSALVKILQHHLHEDNALPLKTNDEGEVVVNTEFELPPRQPGLPPDKSIVYSMFPSTNFPVIRSASSFLAVTLTC